MKCLIIAPVEVCPSKYCSGYLRSVNWIPRGGEENLMKPHVRWYFLYNWCALPVKIVPFDLKVPQMG